ncbi:MAG: shikimate dehydrogenase [Ilumatobacter sp.]
MTRLAGVIGSPVAHSLSPAIHRAAFDAAGVDWTYAAFEVADGAAGDALAAMRTLRIGGLSVTMPHKSDVARLVDRLDPAARALDSVNTVSWDGNDLVGSSTDGAGFVASLSEAGVALDGKRVAVIGAGGAARAVIDALARAGSPDITVLNRNADRAEQAAALTPVASPGIASDITRADIVVNATSVGMGADSADPDTPVPSDPELFRDGQVVADLIYHPLHTRWMRLAADRGLDVVDGLGMLVHQAALQQRIWLGADAVIDTTAMRAAAEDALRQRHR